MDKDKLEQQAQKKSNEEFNSITEKVKPENQNQTHNSRREEKQIEKYAASAGPRVRQGRRF